MTGEVSPSVELVSVDDTVLEQLVRAATRDAAADDVTPPSTTGRSWTPTRVAWLRDFHRDRRAGLAGPAGEATWAVVADEVVVGSVRLKRTDNQGVVETGIWLTRGARGSGVGRAAMALVVHEAATLRASVRADTTVGNTAALAVLQRLGFELIPTGDGCDVQALLRFDPEASDHKRR